MSEDFNLFISTLKTALEADLPGIPAQLLMASSQRAKHYQDARLVRNYREGAVLLCLFKKKNDIVFPLIERKQYEGVHSGQIALPGGKVDPEDKDFYETAVREFTEEIGVEGKSISLIGKLTDIYIPPSNFLVKPVIGFSETELSYIPHEREVESVIECSLRELMDDTIIKETNVPVENDLKIKTPYFEVQGRVLWGATAMILSEFRAVLHSSHFSAFSFL